jgi:hypothetical protein
LIFAGWTVLALANTAQQLVDQMRAGGKLDHLEVLRAALVDCWTWAALTLPIWLFANRFAYAQRAASPAALFHLAGCAGACLVHSALAEAFHIAGPAAQDSLGLRLTLSLYSDFWMYAVIILVASYVHYYQRYSERDLAAAELGQALARAELQALRNQLDPHLLFNALNSVTALMHEDVQAADDMLNDLGQLLRAHLSGGRRQETPLRDELALVQAYVNVQRRRFADRLSFSTLVDEEVLDAEIPALLLQPLVENAILHGIAPRAAGGSVRVLGRRRGEELALEVCDDGQGMAPGCKEGVGLSSTRTRLRQRYGSRQTFDVRSAGAGVTVTIVLPLRIASAPDPSA